MTMETLRDPISSASSPPRRRFRGQGLVEFALILPVMLLVLFVIIEFGRLLFAWLAVENGARFGVRYAVTGELDAAYCLDSGDPGDTPCDIRAEEDDARIPSIEDAARAGSVGILRNETVLEGEAGYYRVTVCSSRRDDTLAPIYTYVPAVPGDFISADCTPTEDAGGPGDRVSVTVDFDHPLITPILSSWWPELHLTARREGIVEQFRVARVVGLP
ncbi:MAG: pilus assembly protein, partial [Anaerolineales bacterium]|nr:pilus assembly protein [Anaerolineales bacterium]